MDRRKFHRIGATFPVELEVENNIPSKIVGEIDNISEGGLGLFLESSLPQYTSFIIRIGLPCGHFPIKVPVQLIWENSIAEYEKFNCGVRFLKLEDEHLFSLRKILSQYKFLDKRFTSLIENMRQFLKEIKNKFDKFDKTNSNKQREINFIDVNKRNIFDELTYYFDEIWHVVEAFDKDKYIIHQDYCQQILGYLLLDLIETNRRVYRKPLGYSGDYMMMNYIYDYHDNQFLGDSSYQKLINNYTCNIPVSCSNIKRKNFLKQKILETMKTKNRAKIMSVGCGSVRELIELLKEGKITESLSFECLDFEKRALDYVSNEIDKIAFDKKQTLSISYIRKNIAGIIRDKKLKEEIKGKDLIYASGIFDYLTDKMASRLAKELYQLLHKGGVLVICNINLENSSHRAYYELVGGWNMIYRTKQEMLGWIDGMKDVWDIKFEELSESSNYLFLTIRKL